MYCDWLSTPWIFQELRKSYRNYWIILIEQTRVLCSQKETDLPFVPPKFGNPPPRLSELSMKNSLNFSQIGNARGWVPKFATGLYIIIKSAFSFNFLTRLDYKHKNQFILNFLKALEPILLGVYWEFTLGILWVNWGYIWTILERYWGYTGVILELYWGYLILGV